MLRSSDEETSLRDFIRLEDSRGRRWISTNHNEISFYPNTAERSRDGNRYPYLRLQCRNDTLLDLSCFSAPTNSFGFWGSSGNAREVTLFSHRPGAWHPLRIAINHTDRNYEAMNTTVQAVQSYWDSR
ncbi:hypothetical protein Xekk_03496 [Xenorhabdus sp. KK7.4]|nr:hypothetical protein Xekk_03496 [Xenorhabdus sp. KK7.4]